MIIKYGRKILAIVLTLGLLIGAAPTPAQANNPYEYKLYLYVHINGNNSYDPNIHDPGRVEENCKSDR